MRDYLKNRSIDEDLADRCHGEGIVCADRRGNAVFAMRGPDGSFAGAEIVGIHRAPGHTPFRGLARGSSRKRGGFWIRCPTMPRNPIGGTVLTVESAIDALSAWLLPLTRKPDFILSTAGATTSLSRNRPFYGVLHLTMSGSIWCGSFSQLETHHHVKEP